MNEEIAQEEPKPETTQKANGYTELQWLAQTFQKNGEQCNRASRDETLPRVYRHQQYGQAQLYFAWAEIFREWKEQGTLSEPPSNADDLRQLNKMLTDRSRQQSE